MNTQQLLTKSQIEIIGQSLGITALDNNVINKIAFDVEYSTKEIIQVCLSLLII